MQRFDVAVVHLRCRPVLDRHHVWHLFADPHQRIERVGKLVAVLKNYHWQVRRIRDQLHMGDTHLRTSLNTAHAERTRREAEQSGCAVRVRHARDIRSDVATVCVYAANQGHAVAYLVG